MSESKHLDPLVVAPKKSHEPITHQRSRTPGEVPTKCSLLVTATGENVDSSSAFDASGLPGRLAFGSIRKACPKKTQYPRISGGYRG